MPGYRSEKTRAVKTATALLGCVALVACATLLRQPIEQTRTRLSLQQSAPGIGAMKLPADIAFAQASLGTFRALATTVLWSRASRLQREGNYFESMRLADWITKLQPRFSRVWEFYATNMTYNISVATRTPQERWLWVNSGITLLRNRGIPLNPGKANLYAELSRFFFDKIGGTNDETHLYYKLRLAEEWHDLLGTPAPGSAGQKADWFRPVADAYSRYILPAAGRDALEELQESSEETKLLLRELRQLGIEPGRKLLIRLAACEADENFAAAGKKAPAGDDAFGQWVLKNRGTAPWQKLVALLRAQVLVNDYRMDPAWMLSLMEKSGRDPATGKVAALSIDWRHPAAHALYWADLGIHRSRTMTKIDEFSIAQARHYYRNALGELAMNGAIDYDRYSGYYRRSAQADCIEAYRHALLDFHRGGQPEAGAVPPAHDDEHPDHEHEAPPQRLQDPGEGHGLFLGWAVRTFYFSGRQSLAETYYQRLGKLIKEEPGEAPVPLRPETTLEEFIMASLVSADSLGQPSQTRPVIEELLVKAVTEGYAHGSKTAAGLYLSTARRIHSACLARGEDKAGTTSLPAFEELVDGVLIRYLLNSDGKAPPPWLRAKAWSSLPGALQARVYDRVRAPLQTELEKLGLDASAAFPPPAGS